MQEKREEKKKNSHSHLTEIDGRTMHHAVSAFSHVRKEKKGKVQTFSFVFWFSALRSSYSPIAERKKESNAIPPPKVYCRKNLGIQRIPTVYLLGWGWGADEATEGLLLLRGRKKKRP